MILTNITIETELKRTGYRQEHSSSCLIIKVPLPGGTANYRLSVSNEFRESIEHVSQLSEKAVQKEVERVEIVEPNEEDVPF